MAKRIRVGINFTHDENWIGGTYYIINLINSLKTLPEDKKPHIVIISWNRSDYEMVLQSGYPHLSFLNFSIPLNPAERLINRVSRMILGRNVINKVISDKHVDLVFPSNTSRHFDKVSRKIFWIPDFQEIYFPKFFSSEQIALRKQTQEMIVASGLPVVFSSKNAQSDFRKIYPGAKNNTYVLNFAVTHPDFTSLNLERLKEKFGITKKYFFIPNQFWIHKNQLLVLKAVTKLAASDAVQFVFTGKESDSRNPDYFDSLKKFISDNKIDDKVKFLGFIDRNEQLKLMSGSLAVIQPSLFEGWSTVVEDAKAMNKFILLSDLAVHHEQISDNCIFFNPEDAEGLASELKKIITNGVEERSQKKYLNNINRFAADFMNIIDLGLK